MLAATKLVDHVREPRVVSCAMRDRTRITVSVRGYHSELSEDSEDRVDDFEGKGRRKPMIFFTDDIGSCHLSEPRLIIAVVPARRGGPASSDKDCDRDGT